MKKSILTTTILLLLSVFAFAGTTTKADKDCESTNCLQLVTSSQDKNPLILVNGKEVDMTTMKSIKPEDIKSVEVLKDEEFTESYGEKGKNGVVKITLKSYENLEAEDIVALNINEANPLVFIDDIELPTYNLLKYFDTDNIESISVLKDKAAIKAYGGKGDNGVILVTMKQKEAAVETLECSAEECSIGSPCKPTLVIVNDIELPSYELIQYIDNKQIGAITILKDQNAIELYGSKGENGVMLITMKE